MNILDKLNAIKKDKLLHFIGGVILFSVGNAWSIYAGAAVVLITSFAKEVYDFFNREKHTPDIYDAFSTIIGGSICMLFTLTSGIFK